MNMAFVIHTKNVIYAKHFLSNSIIYLTEVTDVIVLMLKKILLKFF